MPDKKENKVTAPKQGAGTASACQKALAETCKALKAFSFYPENHPLREQLLQSAYHAVADLTKAGKLSLIVQRDGFSLADGQAAIDNTPMTKALAQELFARELQRITFLPELSLLEFSAFLSLLAVVPQKMNAAGGVAGMLAKSGIQTIVVNQIDITAVFTKKKVGEAADEAVADGTEIGEDREPDTEQAKGSSDHLNKLSIEELIAAMSAETDDEKHGQLARMLLEKARPLKLEGNFDRLYFVLIAMLEQNAEVTRSAASRGGALMILQQLGLGEMTEHLLDHLEDPDFAQKQSIYLILNQLGAEVVDAVIRRLIAVVTKSSRKSAMYALLRIGTPAQQSLIALLKDGRWQVVHTAVAILGEMGNRDAVKGLAPAAYHADHRVRVETIRALAKIGGMEATALLTALMTDNDQGIATQAITWLGNSRNQMALQPLLQLIMKRDLLGKSQARKTEAVVAVGRIGDRRALEPLFRLVKKRYWFAPSRWDELKLLAVGAIANLGGEPARVFLQNQSTRNGRLGQASSAALESMAQRGEDHD